MLLNDIGQKFEETYHKLSSEISQPDDEIKIKPVSASIHDLNIGKQLIERRFAGDSVGQTGEGFCQAVLEARVHVSQKEVAVAIDERVLCGIKANWF